MLNLKSYCILLFLLFPGTTHPEDGLMKLKQMESSTGIWTMRCLLIVESRHIIVIDKGNGVSKAQKSSLNSLYTKKLTTKFLSANFKKKC